MTRDTRTAIVVGVGAEEGLGGALCARFAREGLHVLPAFVAAKGADGLLDLDAIADTYWHLHTQHPTAWSHEVDLRPYKEPF